MFDRNYQTEFLHFQDSSDLTETVDKVEDILHSYDFIGVTERLDESLVVLAMVLDLQLDDLVYISSKQTGFAFTGDGRGNFECVRLATKSYTHTMHTYLASEEWTGANQDDLLLYKAANTKLDSTISHLGKSKVLSSLHRFQNRLQEVQEACRERTYFPCTPEGTLNLNKSNCYARDEGKSLFACVSIPI